MKRKRNDKQPPSVWFQDSMRLSIRPQRPEGRAQSAQNRPSHAAKKRTQNKAKHGMPGHQSRRHQRVVTNGPTPIYDHVQAPLPAQADAPK